MTIAEGTRRVLVADDDSAIREMLSVNLEMLLTATAGDADVWRGWRTTTSPSRSSSTSCSASSSC